MNKPAIQGIAEFVCQHPSSQHPESAYRRAELAWLDTIGCMLLGANSKVASVAYQAALGWGDGNAPVVGTGHKLPAPWAAVVNGAGAHSLDLDDFTFIANDHPSAVLVPALLSATNGHESEISGKALLDAYLIGMEIIFCMGEAVNMPHYNLGWHTTSTLDSLGATAAVCRLWQLGGGQTAAAISLTTSMGSGYVSQFGTSGKPLHAGFSAKSALVAASLAKSGATAQIRALDGPVSFASLLVPAGEASFDDAITRLGNPWGIEQHGLGAKVYPSCGYVHRAVDAAILARRELGLQDISQVESVTASIPDFHLAVLPYGIPNDRTEALFSASYCVATALATGDNAIDDFSHEAVQRADILELAGKVSVESRRTRRPELNFDEDDPDFVMVQLNDGRSVRCEVPIFTGGPGNDLSEDQFVAKFRQCFDHYRGSGGSTAIHSEKIVDVVSRLKDLEEISVLLASIN